MDPYGELFEAYLEELRAARGEALAWWKQLQEELSEQAVDRDAAAKALKSRWPLGPTPHPRVIAVYRKYYLAVDALNSQRLEAEEAAPDPSARDDSQWRYDEEDDASAMQHPRSVLYERLDAVDPSLARFMDGLIFVPVGADRDGRLV